MIKSVFLRRILLLIAVTILLSAVVTTIIYVISVQSVFTRMTASDLVPRAQYYADLMTQYLDGNIPAPVVRDMISESSSMGASLHVYDVQGGTFSELQQGDYDKKDEVKEDYAKLLSSTVTDVTNGQQEVSQVHSATTDKDYLVVGIPVTQSGKVAGAVLLTKPLVELNESLSALYNSLYISMLIAFAIMLVPSFFAARHMVRPINRMRDAALSMADGVYSARADESGKSEVGQLGQALNYLARQLSVTISSLVIERNRLRHTLDGLGEGLVAVDAGGAITHTNPAVLRMFGHEGGTHAAERTALIPDASVWADFDRVLAEKSPLVRTLDREGVVLRVSITSLEDENGKTVGAVGLFRDVTEAARLEQMQRDYVANVSHELRTPLSGVRGLAEALHDGVVKSENDKQRYYGYILRESMRLSRLIDDLLELSRLQSGTVAVQCVSVDVVRLLREVGEHTRTLIEEVGLEYSLTVAEGECPRAWTNADRVEQVLIILLDNAVKFTPENGRVGIGVTWDEEKIYVAVEDEGAGISKEDLPRLFDRFYKSDKARAGGGTGLGLSIAHEVLGMMGETIKVQSEEGKGSKFTFTLRREDAPGRADRAPKP